MCDRCLKIDCSTTEMMPRCRRGCFWKLSLRTFLERVCQALRPVGCCGDIVFVVKADHTPMRSPALLVYSLRFRDGPVCCLRRTSSVASIGPVWERRQSICIEFQLVLVSSQSKSVKGRYLLLNNVVTTPSPRYPLLLLPYHPYKP